MEHLVHKQGALNDEIRDAFRILDAQNRGQVPVEDLKSLLKSYGEMSDDDLNLLLEGTAPDRPLNWDEFVNVFLPRE